MSYAYETPNEKAISGVLALAMHLAFFVLIVLGVTWQHKRTDSAVLVDLWSALPPPAQPRPEPPKPAPRPPKPVPEPPKPAPEPPKPAPEPPKPAPEPPKPAPEPPKPEPKPAVNPDIELKAKIEKERKEKERIERERAEAKRLAEEKRRAEEKKRAEAKQREEERKRAEAKKREAAEQERIRVAALKEKQAQEAAQHEQREAMARLAAQQAAAQQREIDKYRGLIRDRIRRFIVEPPNLQGNPEVEFDVVVLPGGEVLNVKMKKSSGVAAYDSAVERAIIKAQPLPLPPDASLHKEFRDLNLKFRPKE